MSDLSTGSISSSRSAVDLTAMQDRLPAQNLGQNDFLKLLAKQMSAQDPLNPQQDTSFIAQMAQFSALENSKQMQTEMQTLRASQLIGQTVDIKIDEDSSVHGVVTAMQMSKDGLPQIVVNGEGYSVSDVIHVAPTPVSTTSN